MNPLKNLEPKYQRFIYILTGALAVGVTVVGIDKCLGKRKNGNAQVQNPDTDKFVIGDGGLTIDDLVPPRIRQSQSPPNYSDKQRGWLAAHVPSKIEPSDYIS